jgi:hypothetical protein
MCYHGTNFLYYSGLQYLLITFIIFKYLIPNCHFFYRPLVLHSALLTYCLGTRILLLYPLAREKTQPSSPLIRPISLYSSNFPKLLNSPFSIPASGPQKSLEISFSKSFHHYPLPLECDIKEGKVHNLQCLQPPLSPTTSRGPTPISPLPSYHLKTALATWAGIPRTDRELQQRLRGSSSQPLLPLEHGRYSSQPLLLLRYGRWPIPPSIIILTNE